MKICGIDFTSRPCKRKPLTCMTFSLDGDRLSLTDQVSWPSFDGLDAFLRSPGPWIAGLDFPFGQPRNLIDSLGWRQNWEGYVAEVGRLGPAAFQAEVEAFKAGRPTGQKEYRRKTDIAASSISPMKFYGVPVGKMFAHGAPRLVEAGVTVPGLRLGDGDRIVVEAYPGVAIRSLIGRRPYKTDAKRKQTEAHHQARQEVATLLRDGKNHFSLRIDMPDDAVNDPTGDRLDSIICAAQAAWAWQRREDGYGMPRGTDRLEGWIADPTLV
ncbi:DUF429 domain-containing protein [Paracoccus sanguinis]|uniref:DUF429 domain-containing protein n=1 Tax=Paracoccus sanguinis TaxID=1545044 RepID=UPI00051F8D0E|nr:DUF429 domain-containing protein [Paracoccus sanguinis]KGJ13744.1 hypothetical protein IX54_10420 [Paracoccus sanguinis]